jgi:uncharacterized repeat protein (TIGR03803 family)
LGNLYGTTEHGGSAPYLKGWGVVYKFDVAGHYTALHTFTDGSDGGLPNAVMVDAKGNLYGTTFGGGAGSKTGVQEGVVFKLDPAGKETVLYAFTGLDDGGGPSAGVIRDPAGALYGTTTAGGNGGAGVVFKLDPRGKETVLHAFTGQADGATPFAGVIRDEAGNLYGAAGNFGRTPTGNDGGGVIFRVDAAGNFTPLYTFSGTDGALPFGGLVLDRAGNLYGTTLAGGNLACDGDSGCGVVFEITPAGQEILLHIFENGPDGSEPAAALTLDKAGNLYGTADHGAEGGGVLFRLNTH